MINFERKFDIGFAAKLQGGGEMAKRIVALVMIGLGFEPEKISVRLRIQFYKFPQLFIFKGKWCFLNRM